MPCSQIAKAANYCEAYFTAVLYAELESIEKGCGSENEARLIMKNAYVSIGEMDAVPAFLDPLNSRLQYYQLNQNWNQIYVLQDAISYNRPNSMQTYSDYLNESGLYCLAHTVSKSQETTVNYDCAWRLGDWNLIYTDDDNTSDKVQKKFDFDKYHYFALKGLRDRDEQAVKSFVNNARKGVIEQLKQSSFECTKNLYKNLAALQLLQQIEDFYQVGFSEYTSLHLSYITTFFVSRSNFLKVNGLISC